MQADTNTKDKRPALPLPRELTWRGRIAASGFWLPGDNGLLTVAAARTRALDLWDPGATIYAAHDGLLLVLPTPRMVRPEYGPGTPLVRSANVLSSAPLPDADARRLRAGLSGDIVAMVRGGVWEVIALDGSCVVDPAAWLDLGPVTVLPGVVSLGTPPAQVADALPPAAFDARKAFGKVGAETPSELTDVLAALRGVDTGDERKRTAAGAGIGGALGAALAGFFGALRARMEPPTFGRDGKGTVKTGGTAQSERPAVEKESTDPWAWLRWGAARLAGLTGLSALIGRKQSQYIQKMLDLFERGDLEEALRHAIPLGSDLDSLLRSLPPPLTTPTPRSDLTLRPEQTAATSSFGFSMGLHGHLETLYRQAFDRLEREGRVDEAAFVLAELLKRDEEAVNFLEKHDRLALAADMAEARGLPPGWVVRLRFLAGDRDRAVAFARRTGAWADAVTRMERIPERAKEARALRLEWAASLARAGAYGQAVNAALQVREARALVREWMGRVVEGGGVPAAQMRARRLALFPEDEASGRADALALLSGEGEALAPERRAFTAEITRPDTWTTPEALPLQRLLARVAVRALARDTTLGLLPPPPEAQYNALLQVAADPVLKADARPLREVVGLAPAVVRHRALRERSPGDTAAFTVAAGDTGLFAIHDAAYLPSGRTLVALGEMGVRLLAPDGHTIRDWATIPADRLVPADSGNVALALARRGGVWRLTRLDLVTGAITPWCDAAEIPVFAPDSDGSLWMVALPNGGGTQALAALDLQGPPDRLASLWRTPLEAGEFVAIARSSSACAALSVAIGAEPIPFTVPSVVKTVWNWQRWHFEMPSLTMRDRFHWESGSDDGHSGLITLLAEQYQGVVDPTGLVALRKVGYIPASPNDFRARWELWRGRSQAPFPANDRFGFRQGVPPLPLVGNEWLADIQYPSGDPSPTVALLSLTDARSDTDPTRLRVTLAGAGAVGARLFAGHLNVWDDQGRVLAFDLSTGDIAANLRVC